MVPILSLWLPILVSAALVFVASSVIHMLLGYHASDYVALPDEEAVGAAIRGAGVAPGDYTIPYAGSMSEMGSPEYLEKMSRGPVALLTVRRSGPVDMRATMVGWFVFNVAVGVLAGYMASRAVGAGADFGSVFRFAGTTAFAAYAMGSWSESIWFGRKWSTTLKNTADGVVYAVITGLVFAWLWPGLG